MVVLHVQEFGDPKGEPLLAVHGITAHGGRFHRLAGEAWPERRTIAVDLRGHGRSSADAPWNVATLVNDLLDTLDSLQVSACDVVGHSYGGVVSLAMLAHTPERVRRLVLLDPALMLSQDAAQQAAASVIADSGWASRAEAVAERRSLVAPEGHLAVDDDLAEHLYEGDDGRWRLRYHPPAAVTGWGEMCAPIPAVRDTRPTLLVRATRAPFVTPVVVAELRLRLGDALEVAEIDCGHMVYWERFDDTARLVNRFLAG